MTSLSRYEPSEAMARIELPWPHKDLSPNARVNWKVKHRHASALRIKAGWAAVAGTRGVTFQPDQQIRVTTTFFPPDRRSYDEDNLKARMKSAYDGIADAIGVDDKWFRHQPVQIGEVIKGGRVVVALERADTWEHISEPAGRVIASIPVPRRGAA